MKTSGSPSSGEDSSVAGDHSGPEQEKKADNTWTDEPQKTRHRRKAAKAVSVVENRQREDKRRRKMKRDAKVSV